MDYAPGAFLAFLHNLSPAEESAARVPPLDTHTCLLLRPERPRPPRRLHCPRSLFVALSQHAAKSQPRRSTPRFPGRGERGEDQAAPAVGRDTRTAWGGGGGRSSASTPGRVRGKRRHRRAAGEAPGWGTGSGGT